MRLAILFILSTTLWAGDAFIDNVSGYGGFSPGGFALIEGAFFDRTATVTVGGRPAAVMDLQHYYCTEPGCEVGLVIQLPSELSAGPAELVLKAGDKAVSPFPLLVQPAAPYFAYPAVLPYAPYFALTSRGDHVLADGTFAPWSCAPGGTPKSGELFRMYASGMCATEPLVPAGVITPASPVFQTVVKPAVTIGNVVAEVVESILAPGEIGVYRITLRIPPGDGWQTVVLSAGGNAALTSIAVGNASRPPGFGWVASAESIQSFTACGGYLGSAGQQSAGDPRNPGTRLGGITALVRDSRGVERPAPILSVAPDQVSYVLPAGTSAGAAAVTVATADGLIYRGTLDVQAVAPRVLETAAAVSAAYVVRVRGGLQSIEPTFRLNAEGKYEAAPIDLGPEGDQVYLSIFGTGWRSRVGALGSVQLVFSAGIDGFLLSEPAIYAGPNGEFAGVDQVNIKLPRFLAGSGLRYSIHTFLAIDGKQTGVPGLAYK